MKTEDAVKIFGTKTAIAEALGITPNAVSQWGHKVPRRREYQIEKASGGQIKAGAYAPKVIPRARRVTVRVPRQDLGGYQPQRGWWYRLFLREGLRR